jgi:hypothetical protein
MYRAAMNLKLKSEELEWQRKRKHRDTYVVSSQKSVSPRMERNMVTRFVNVSFSPRTMAYLTSLKCTDLTVIRNLTDKDGAYEWVSRALKNGWSGMCLCVYLGEGSFIDVELLKSLEDGILLHKEKGPLVWNSLNIVIFVPNPEHCYKQVIESNTNAKLSSRVMEMEICG